ncbi:hypothetical protein JCGZ_11781 [Jatropha curcas]|uniref:Uncharacterized protein n=1 Tax=Jatropha curcas TaxID=180498 RepID=A0A067KGL2_JATCU|nr:hypothetical protein JCGZ_11781 [Jatropha curcas]
MSKVHGREGHHRQSFTSNNNQKEDASFSGKAHNKEQNLIIHGNRGTRQEWMEELGPDTSQYFTMDYSHVKRRIPIHNKGLPVGP